MKKEHTLSLRAVSRLYPNTVLQYSWIILPLGLLILVPLLILFKRWFPLNAGPGLFAAVVGLFSLYIVGNCVFIVHKVHLSKDKVLLTWCGIRMKVLEPSGLRLLCAVGNEWGNYLCLTCYRVEELAQMEEKVRLRNWITRHEVPFAKKRADYQDSYARKHLLRQAKKSFQLFRREKTIFLPMRTERLLQLQEMYPHLSYRNYTQCSGYKPGDPYSRRDILSIYGLTPWFRTEITEDAILYYSGKKAVRTVPLSTVRSIVRIDIFMASRHIPSSHLPMLFLSTLSLEEMGERSRLAHDSLSLRAYHYAEDQGKHWRISTPNCCNLPCNEITLAKLKERCPDAQWLDLSDAIFQ